MSLLHTYFKERFYMAISITKANYQQEVLDSKIPVVMDVFAVWCGPCQYMKPIFDSLEKEYDGVYKFVVLDVEEDRALSTELGITSIPTFLFFNKGTLVAKELGSVSITAFKDNLKKYFAQ